MGAWLLAKVRSDLAAGLGGGIVPRGHGAADYLGRRGRRRARAIRLEFGRADRVLAVVLAEQLSQIGGQSDIDRAHFRVHDGDGERQRIGRFPTSDRIGQLAERHPDLTRGPYVGIGAAGAARRSSSDFRFRRVFHRVPTVRSRDRCTLRDGTQTVRRDYSMGKPGRAAYFLSGRRLARAHLWNNFFMPSSRGIYTAGIKRKSE